MPDLVVPLSPRVQAATRENGYVVARPASSSEWWTSVTQREETPELRWPQSVRVYDRMRRQDSQVSSVLRAVSHPLLRTPWRVAPNGARPEVVDHVAQDLGLPVKGVQETVMPRRRDRFSWQKHLREALLMLPLGHMPFEQVYRWDDRTGLFRLRKLGPRMPHTITKFNVARDGGLLSIEQRGSGTSPVTIPMSRLVIYVNELEGGEWWGNSILRSAYKNWLIKDRLLRVDAQSIERNGMGIPAYTAPEGANSAGMDAGDEIVAGLRAGDESGATLPSGAKLELLGVAGNIPSALPSIKYHDEQIARGVLAHFLNLGNQTGSWALGSTFADFFSQSLQAIAQEVADTASQHIVEDLVDVNYGTDEPAPLVVCDEIGSKSLAVAQAIKMLVDAGVLTPDDALEAFLRGGLGLPAADQPAPEGTP